MTFSRSQRGRTVKEMDRLLHWLFGGILFGNIPPMKWKQPPASPATPKEILKGLNEKEEGDPWIFVDGYHTLIKSKIIDDKPEFDLGTGLVVKSFINTKTAELKLYVVQLLKVSERPIDR